MSIPPQQIEKIQRVFEKHVAEVASGIVELVSISRDPTKGLLVLVRSRETSVHPVSAISYHLKDISRELAGGKLTVWLWDESQGAPNPREHG